ncbi:hypothetical protein U1Q18_049610 [Sarracenia purpurea var. burkii]
MNSYLKIFIGVFLTSPCLFIKIVQADCCAPQDAIETICDDGSTGRPCCGKGTCNVFCCNCDGGCKKSPYGNDRKKRDVLRNSTNDESHVSLILRTADENGDGSISMTEGLRFIKIQLPHFSNDTLKIELVNLDLNKDGFLSGIEIDSIELS